MLQAGICGCKAEIDFILSVNLRRVLRRSPRQSLDGRGASRRRHEAAWRKWLGKMLSPAVAVAAERPPPALEI